MSGTEKHKSIWQNVNLTKWLISFMSDLIRLTLPILVLWPYYLPTTTIQRSQYHYFGCHVGMAACMVLFLGKALLFAPIIKRGSQFPMQLDFTQQQEPWHWSLTVPGRQEEVPGSTPAGRAWASRDECQPIREGLGMFLTDVVLQQNDNAT